MRDGVSTVASSTYAPSLRMGVGWWEVTAPPPRARPPKPCQFFSSSALATDGRLARSRPPYAALTSCFRFVCPLFPLFTKTHSPGATPVMASTIGLVGLAVMGQNLALNVAEKGFPISVYNRSGDKTDAAVARAQKEGVRERGVGGMRCARAGRGWRAPREPRPWLAGAAYRPRPAPPGVA
jgi:hypothetical protein